MICPRTGQLCSCFNTQWCSMYYQPIINYPNDGFQLCPKCNGSGVNSISPVGVAADTTKQCDICYGKKIIHKQTGQPPL